MLATATPSLPVGEQWAYEFKWDGVRALFDVSERGSRLFSRSGNDISGGYPELVAATDGVGDALLDGEIVAFVDGRPSFEALQGRMHLRGHADVTRAVTATPVTFVAFDLLRRFGVDLTGRPYLERRETLERFAAEHPGWTISPSFDDAYATESVARANGLEGVVAKRLDSAYRPGVRSEDWRKLRFLRAGDFAVIGWEASDAHPRTLSSLLLATVGPDDGRLRFAGKVGSGLSARMAATIRSRLTECDNPAVDGAPPATRGRVLHWVEPSLVVEVAFADRTSEGRLRQPVLRGLRADKSVLDAHGEG